MSAFLIRFFIVLSVLLVQVALLNHLFSSILPVLILSMPVVYTSLIGFPKSLFPSLLAAIACEVYAYEAIGFLSVFSIVGAYAAGFLEKRLFVSSRFALPLFSSVLAALLSSAVLVAQWATHFLSSLVENTPMVGGFPLDTMVSSALAALILFPILFSFVSWGERVIARFRAAHTEYSFD